MNVNQVNESYIYQYNKIYDQYIKNQEKITMTLLNQAVVDNIGANYNDQDYKHCDEEEEKVFIDSIFTNLNPTEKNYLLKLFCYFKQQILYYFSVQDIVVNYQNVNYHNEILDELNDLEILLLFFPHIKDIEGLKTIRTLKDIFLKRRDNNFQFTNMFYSFNDPSTTDIKLDHIADYKEIFVDNIIIYLNTLEKSLCRLYVNWVNVFPSMIKSIDNESILFDFKQTRIFKNTVKEYLKNKDNATVNYNTSAFNIDYIDIRRSLLNSDFDHLKDDQNNYKCFFNYVFPISTLYNSLSYIIFPECQKLYNNASVRYYFNNISQRPELYKSTYNWHVTNQQTKEYFYNFIFKQNFLFINFIFGFLSISGTLNICYYNKNLNKKINRTYKNKSVDITTRLTNNTWFSLNKDLTYFLTNMTYDTTNKYLMDLIKIDHIIEKEKFNFYHDKEIKKKNDLFEKEKSLYLNIKNLLENFDNKYKDFNTFTNQKYYFSRWLNAIDDASTNQSLLYSAQLLPQIKVFNNFINCRVSFVTGGTGTGKSTQLPILLLYAIRAFDYKWSGNVIDTQPRKNAVEGNAKAISNFLGIFPPTLGYNNFIQYQTGDTNITCSDNFNETTLCMKLVTDKILLNELYQSILLTNFTKTQNYIYPKNKYDIVIIDEVHEHNKNMDIILSLMRNIVYINNGLRLILVSATIEDDEPRYRQFFRPIEDIFKYPFNSNYLTIGVSLSYNDRRINISNPSVKTYNIDEYFINDHYSQIIGLLNPYESLNFKKLNIRDYQTIEEINNENTLKILNYEANKNRDNNKHFLIFKSGQKEITDCIEYLINNGVNTDYFFIPWLTSMNQKTKDLTQILEKTNIVDKIKINRSAVLDMNYNINYYEGSNNYKHIVFVATNIVEASITINDLYCVIDDGFQKIGKYDYNLNSTVIEKTIISNQSRLQRRGRVGRTADGVVYYLYKKNDIIDSTVKYKICYENFITDYFDLLEYEDKENIEVFRINKNNCPLKIKAIDYQLHNKEYEDYSYFNYYTFLYNNYISISNYLIINNFFSNSDNLFHDKNNKNLSFFTDELIYSSNGYPKNIINDTTGNFYIIHPNENDIKRNINGKILTPLNKEFITYCEDYYVLYLLLFKNGTYVKSSYSYDINTIYSTLFNLFNYIDFNGLLYNLTQLIILTYSNEELKSKALNLFYVIYIFYFASSFLSFDFIDKNINVFNFDKIDDFEYISEVLDKDYYKNLEEVEELKKLYNKQDFIKLFDVLEELDIDQIHEEVVNEFTKNGLDVVDLNFNQLLVLCFYQNIVSSYKNTKSYIPKKIKDTKTIEIIKEQNKYLFINIAKPVNKEIKISYQNSILRYTDNPDYNNNQENYYIYFSFNNKESFNFISLTYKINKEDLIFLYFPIKRMNEFKYNNKTINTFITPLDYLIDSVYNSNEIDKYINIYQYIYYSIYHRNYKK